MKKQIFTFFRKYFGFSHNEIKGSIVLIISLFFIISYKLGRNLFIFYEYRKIISKNKTIEKDTEEKIVKNCKDNNIEDSKNTKKDIQRENYSKQNSKITVLKNHNSQKLFDINQISIDELKSYFTFSDTISKRIIKFRKALGGFINVEQLLEVYGIDKNECKKKINQFYIPTENHVHKISINTASIKELLRHPYIDYSTALEIVQFREKQKKKIFLEDLKKIDSLKKTIKKIEGYLTT